MQTAYRERLKINVAKCDSERIFPRMISESAAAKGRKRPRRPHRYGTADIARLAGKTPAAVRQDKTRGKLDADNLLSVARYLMDQPCNKNDANA